MHEVKVEVLETEVLQSVLDGQLDVLGVVVKLKELGGNPKLLSGNTGCLDTLTDFGLISVGPGAATSEEDRIRRLEVGKMMGRKRKARSAEITIGGKGNLLTRCVGNQT